MISPNVIEAKFLRSKRSYVYTKVWKQVEPAWKDIVSEKSNLSSKEEPILCFYPNTVDGWLLTNKRLLIFENDPTVYFDLTEFYKVEVEDIFENGVNKLECTRIQLFTKSKCINLVVEIRSWHIILSIFRFIINKINPKS